MSLTAHRYGDAQLPPLVSSLPMTLDDSLSYTTGEIGAVFDQVSAALHVLRVGGAPRHQAERQRQRRRQLPWCCSWILEPGQDLLQLHARGRNSGGMPAEPRRSSLGSSRGGSIAHFNRPGFVKMFRKSHCIARPDALLLQTAGDDVRFAPQLLVRHALVGAVARATSPS